MPDDPAPPQSAKPSILLASVSLRHKALMEQLGFVEGIDFLMAEANVRPSGCGEEEGAVTLEAARARTIKRAREKISHLAHSHHSFDAGRTVVIGADTAVFCGGRLLKSPLLPVPGGPGASDIEIKKDDATRMLRETSGRTLSVITGLVAAQADSLDCERSTSVVTNAFMKKLSERDVERCAAGDWAFEGDVIHVRGVLLIEKIEGSYSNLFGLPLAELYGLLRDTLFAGRAHLHPSPTQTSKRKPRGTWTPASPRILLASRSPQRFALLCQLVAPSRIEVRPAGHPESHLPDETPQERVVRLAREKARRILEKKEFSDDIEVLLAADTEVVLPGDHGRLDIVAHPHDSPEAVTALRQLSGKEHLVITGIAVIGVDPEQGARGLKCISECVSTSVRFRRLPETEIMDYIESGECFGRAGAYAIQGKGAILVESIDGSYSNVVGLPLERLAEILKVEFGLPTGAMDATSNTRPSRRLKHLLE